MVNPSCSLSREVQRKLRVLVLGYLMEQNLSSTPVHVKALEGAIFQALFDSLFRQLASRKGNVNVFARKYEEWLRCSLELAERLSSVGKSANALAVLVAGAQRLDLRDLRAGRHKKGLPYEIELLFQLDQVRRQLKRGPRRTSENLRQRVDFLSNALRSDPIRTILYGTSIPDTELHELAQADPLDIACAIVTRPYDGALRPENLKKRLPSLRKKQKAGLDYVRTLLK